MTTQVSAQILTEASKSGVVPGVEEVIGVVVIALLAAAAVTALFVMVVVGIRASERRAGLPGPARGRADRLARRILAAHFLPSPICSQKTSRLTNARRSSR